RVWLVLTRTSGCLAVRLCLAVARRAGRRAAGGRPGDRPHPRVVAGPAGSRRLLVGCRLSRRRREVGGDRLRHLGAAGGGTTRPRLGAPPGHPETEGGDRPHCPGRGEM